MPTEGGPARIQEGFVMAMERWHPFSSVDRWEPFRNLVDIQGEVNRLFDAVVGRPATGSMTQSRPWLPTVDMHETRDNLVLKLDVPGMREKDIAVSITG